MTLNSTCTDCGKTINLNDPDSYCICAFAHQTFNPNEWETLDAEFDAKCRIEDNWLRSLSDHDVMSGTSQDWW